MDPVCLLRSSSIIGAESGILVFRNVSEYIIMSKTILSIFKKNCIYRVIQEESAILWEMIVCVILSKKVHINMCPIFDGYGVMGIF